MARDAQPGMVRDFVIRSIDSVAELEGLLLVRRDAAQRWSAAPLAARLYVSEAEALKVLRTLEARRLVARHDDGFSYHPGSDEIRAQVDALAEAYPRFLVPITRLIHDKPRASLRDFADAFRWRDDE